MSFLIQRTIRTQFTRGKSSTTKNQVTVSDKHVNHQYQKDLLEAHAQVSGSKRKTSSEKDVFWVTNQCSESADSHLWPWITQMKNELKCTQMKKINDWHRLKDNNPSALQWLFHWMLRTDRYYPHTNDFLKMSIENITCFICDFMWYEVCWKNTQPDAGYSFVLP